MNLYIFYYVDVRQFFNPYVSIGIFDMYPRYTNILKV